MSGIDSLDIERGIRFGKAQSLCLLQNNIELLVFIGHFGQNKIGSAIHDSQNRVDFIGHKAFFQSFDNRNSAAHTSFKTDIYPFLLGSQKYFIAVSSQKSFLGGDNMFPLSDSL